MQKPGGVRTVAGSETSPVSGNYHEHKEPVVMVMASIDVKISEMNITGTLPQVGNLKLFVPSLSTQGSTRPKQNIFNVVLMRPDKTE